MSSLVTVSNGRYEAQRRLGVGAYASVYLAVDHILHRTVAVKEVARQPSQPDPLAEYDMLRALSHPNIVKVYEW